MRLINKDDIEIVDAFIRIFGDKVSELAPHYQRDIEFKRLRKSDNHYGDVMGRLGNVVYISPEEVGRLGLSDTEMLATIAHEIGHIVYSTCNWQPDCEERADSFAADLGLGTQMISAIEKILDSKRYEKLTRMLIGRIHYLQNMMRG